MNHKLAKLKELAEKAPEVVFQEDRESDRFYTAANPKTIITLVSALEQAQETLKFYAEAKILFLSKNGTMPEANDLRLGIFKGGMKPTAMHIKDDGNNARDALTQIEEELQKL